jgi:hypothetical protein
VHSPGSWPPLSGSTSRGFRSSYLAEREAEVRTLTDARVQEAIAGLDIQLANYTDFERWVSDTLVRDRLTAIEPRSGGEK